MPSPKINLTAMVKKKIWDKKTELIEEKVTSESVTNTDVNTQIISESKLNDSVFKSKEEKESELAKKEVKDEEIKKSNEEVNKTSLMPKISLSSIKTTKSVVEIKEKKAKDKIDEHARKKEELLEVLVDENNSTNIDNNIIANNIEQSSSENNSESANKEVINTENNDESSNKEDNNSENDDVIVKTDEEKLKELEEIERKIDEKVEEEVNKKIKKSDDNQNKEILDDKEELFWNYKSEFIEKEDKIIEKVETEKKKFTDRIRLPKTRVLLVIGLILLTISIVWALFKIDPKNHSIDIYKNAIIKNVDTIKTTYIVKPWVLEVINIEWYSFNTYSQKQVFKKTSYKYNEIVYDTKENMEIVINNELLDIKQAEEAEKARIAAEQARIAAEKLIQEQQLKNKTSKEKIKIILKLKYNELIKLYQK